jgi:YggT family protein
MATDVISNFLSAIAVILHLVLNGYMIIIIASALISWVNPDPYNPIVRFLYRASEPALRPVRRTLGAALGGIDISPIIVILVIYFLDIFVVGSLQDIARGLR